VEGTWTRSTLPKLDGTGRTERQWELQAGYQPAPGADLSGTYRWLDAEGRLRQRERYGTVTASWRIGARGRLSVDGTRREAVTPFSRTLERVVGVDAAFGLPAEFRGKASWRASTRRGLPRRTQIGVTVSRAF